MGIEQINTKGAFDARLISADSKVVIVDFFATWCGPCKLIAPKIEEMAKTEFSNCIFLKVDVDENAETAEEYEVAAMPTFMLFKGGKKVGEVVGASVDNVKAAISKALETKN